MYLVEEGKLVKEMEDQNDLTKLRQVKWRTNLSRLVSEFSEIIKDDEVFEKYFGEKYVEKLTNKSKEITRTIIKLGLVYTILMLSLYASQNTGGSEFEFFGYGFKNLEKYKEFLLLMAVVVSPVSVVLSAYQRYLLAIVNACLNKMAPDDIVRQFYSHLYLDGYFDGLIGKKSGGNTSQHGLFVFLLVAFVVTMLLLFFTFVVASFFIQISVIYNVAMKPSSSHYLNLFVVLFSIVSILFSWLVGVLQFPMPEVDVSNYSKLFELEKQNPEKYKEAMRRVASESARKDALSIIVLSVVIYISAFAGIAMYWFPDSLDNLSYFLEKAMPGAFIVMFLTSQLVRYFRKQGMSWFFRKYRDESSQRLRIFKKFQNILFLIKIVLPLCLSCGYAVYALSST
jgi:hypothetical protein